MSNSTNPAQLALNVVNKLLAQKDSLMQFEINTQGNKTIFIDAADADSAIKPILALLGLTGDELMLDEDDWRGYDFFDGRSVYTPVEIIENDLECTSTDVHFTNYRDITSLINSGAWHVVNGRAYCLPRLPKVRPRLKRGQFNQVRLLITIAKLKQLERLGRARRTWQEET